MDQINKLRDLIDILDNQIMELLNNRYDLSERIGELKSKTKAIILDVNRESIILGKTSKYSHYPQINSVYKAIMNESKLIQNRK